MRKQGKGAFIFLSYARPDRDLVASLADLVERRGYRAWWDDLVRAGDAFDSRIIEALDTALAVVVIWSSHSIQSRWVRWEATQGLRMGKLVPLAVAGLDLADIRPPFADLNTLELKDETRLFAALSRLARDRRSG